MKKFDTKKYPIYASFLNQLAKDLTKFYYAKLDKPFKITNKMKGKGYDPVTTSDKAFEKFIRSKISKKFPNHQIIGEEYGHKLTKSEFSWVIDPIDGTRSYVVGNPSWSNLISLNYNGEPILGLANFPKMRKYYLNVNKNIWKKIWLSLKVPGIRVHLYIAYVVIILGGRMRKKNCEKKLIRSLKDLSKKALREPRTIRELALRKKWERLKAILKKRYDYMS